MAIIYSYPETTDLLPTDMLVGTSTIRVAGKKKNITKNFTLDALRGFILQGYSTVTWGSITGILSNQTDLQAALNAKQGNITLTTTGSTGAATLIGNTLNIPNYASGIVTQTLNQVLTAGNVSLLDAKVGNLYSYDTVNADYGIVQFYDSGVSLKAATTNNLLFFNDDTGTVSFSNGAYDPILNFAGVGNNVYTFQNANGTLAFLSDIPSVSGYVPTSRTLTINGTSYDLTSDRTWSVGTVTSVGATGPITSSGGTTPTISTSMATNKLIGRSTAGTGVMEEITIGTGLSLSAGTLSASSIAGAILHATATGTDTYSATISGVTSYADGDAYLIRFTNGNTTVCTLNINTIGAIPLYRNNDGQLIGGDIWDGGEMLCTYNSTLNIFQCIGTSPNSLFSYITNADSVAITKGQPVYAFGGTGDRMTVKRAFNTSDATSAKTVGIVVTSSIAVNQKGIIIIQGLLDGLSILPTATWTDGDTVYLGTTAGSITNVKQYAPNHLVYLGTITTASNGSTGRWYVRVQNGYELDELHNVQAQSPSLNDTLWYDNTVTPGQWKTASIPTILGYTPTTNARTISTTSPLQGGGDLSANRTLSILQSSGSQDGYLSSTDWTTFNSKFTLPSFTSGSVLFSNGTTIAQDNANFFWDDTNNRLGIGTTTPTNRLTVLNSTAPAAAIIGGGTSTPSWMGIGTLDSGTVPFIQGYNNLQTLITNISINPSGGNVGIGITTPEVKLDVYGSGTVQSRVRSASGGDIRFSADTFGRVGTYSASDLALLTSGTEKVRITTTGNVGIGTTAPATKLEVGGSVFGEFEALRLVNTANVAPNRGTSQTFYIPASTGSNEIGGKLLISRSSDNVGSYMAFSTTTTNAAGVTEKMRIAASGNVGIGTTAPTSKLQVVGLPSYLDNAAAIAGGLTVGAFYHTTGVVKVVI